MIKNVIKKIKMKSMEGKEKITKKIKKRKENITKKIKIKSMKK